MIIGIPKERAIGENRMGMGPDSIKKLIKKGFSFRIESGAGKKAFFSDQAFSGAEIVAQASVYQSDVIVKINRPTHDEIQLFKPDTLLICLAEPYLNDDFFNKLCEKKINCLSLEKIPRTSRAQSMDVLSSQANIAGYRAVLEASYHYNKYFPMMMTSAGMSKPAKVAILGVGVAGLQAIATAKRLGAVVEAFDVRPEVKEQILSLGAKYMDLGLKEEGRGAGGYAKELSEEGKKAQQEALTEKLKSMDIIISTANIPGKKSPVLITPDAVNNMKAGSVIIDMAAAGGGNCPLTKKDQVITENDVTIVGYTNYPSQVASDATQFFGNNIANLLGILTKDGKLDINLNDDIIATALVTYQGDLRTGQIKGG